MSDILDTLRSRRSIRVFRKTPVNTDQIEILKESLLRAPTSRGRSPWHFIMVDDGAVLGKIALAKTHGSAFIAGAPLAFVICADTTVSDVWIEDCSIAAITLQYTAHSLGLGSCWAQIRLREHGDNESAESYLKQQLGIPDQFSVASIIGIGHPAEEKEGHLAEHLPDDKFHVNRF